MDDEVPESLMERVRGTAAWLLKLKIFYYFHPKTREEQLAAIDFYMSLLKQEMIDQTNLTFDADDEINQMFPPAN